MTTTADLPSELHPARTAFFLDVDGTLLDFKEDPQAVVADERLRTALCALEAASNGAVALVSGRTLADLDRIVAPLVLPAAGTHGAEVRFADGRCATTTADLGIIRRQIEAFAASREGLSTEDKGNAIAVHFRRAPDRAGEVAAFLDGLLQGQDLAVQHGKCVAEIKPRHAGKGMAIAALMDTPPFHGRRPLFVGDDLTDEDGFRQVNAAGGISIKVGAGETIARYVLANASCVLGLLEQITKVSK